jgi:hypothetical protein
VVRRRRVRVVSMLLGDDENMVGVRLGWGEERGACGGRRQVVYVQVIK